MLREFSPHAVAYAVRCKADSLRAWRSAGHLEGLGHRDGKGHLFSVLDVCRISVAAFLARAGVGLAQAFEIVAERGVMIDSIAKSEAGDDYVITLAINPDLSGLYSSVTGAPLACVEMSSDIAGALQVNLSMIVRSTIGRLNSFRSTAS